MKFVVFSDLHGNSLALQTLLASIDKNKVDAFICCGDIVGYYYEELQIVRMLQDLPRLYIVKGNHDAMYCQAEEDENFKWELCKKYGNAYRTIHRSVCEYLLLLPEKIRLMADEKKFLIVHGTEREPFNGRVYPDSDLSTCEFDYDIVFCGHTHYSMVKMCGHSQIINPGSLGQPRDGKGFSYGVYDTATGNWSLRTIVPPIDALLRQIEMRDSENQYLRSVLFRGRNFGNA